jgi:hypothetical protein
MKRVMAYIDGFNLYFGLRALACVLGLGAQPPLRMPLQPGEFQVSVSVQVTYAIQ